MPTSGIPREKEVRNVPLQNKKRLQKQKKEQKTLPENARMSTKKTPIIPKKLKAKNKVAVKKTKCWQLYVNMNADNDDDSTKAAKSFSSRWSEFNSLKKVKTCMLSTPVKKARIVQKLMESPHTKALLEKIGSIMPTSARNKLGMSQKILASIRTTLTEIKAHGGMNRSKKIDVLDTQK